MPLQSVGKATLRETREHNERLVLATIYDRGPVSRAEVARLTNLTRTTVSAVVDGLLEQGMAREVGRGPSTGGKAPILLVVPDDARLLVGVDLGDRAFVAATISLRGDVLHRIEVPSEDSDGQEAVELALTLIEQVIAAARGVVVGIGIGAPGLVDTTDGTVIQAVKRSWRGLPLGTIVAERFGLPVYVANDSQAAALAEHVFGASRGANLVGIKVGEGIGAGIVIGGSLFQGDGFGAGEIGHTVVVDDGAACRCGRCGCLETVANVRAVLDLAARDGGPALTLDQAVAACRHGDPRVAAAVEEAGRQLGRVVAGIVGALHIRRIVLAGPMAAFGDTWLRAVADAALGRSLATLAADTAIELGGTDDIVLLGASALLMTRELGLRIQPLHPALRASSAAAPSSVGATAGRGPAATAAGRGGDEP